MQVLLATANLGKVRELEEMLTGKGVTVLSLSDFPNYEEVEETGRTFSENALLKARAAAAQFNMVTLADDSGLEVDALEGAPGVFSARYAGEPKNDEKNIEKLLADLEDIPEEKRTARFRCCLAIVGDGQNFLTEGSVEGKILFSKRGTGGFGYDPVFYIPILRKTMAEISLEEKNTLSHRAQAFKKAVPILLRILEKNI